MTVRQISSGPISLSSAGSWLINELNRRGITAGAITDTAAMTSVGSVWSTDIGSDRVAYEALISSSS